MFGVGLTLFVFGWVWGVFIADRLRIGVGYEPSERVEITPPATKEELAGRRHRWGATGAMLSVGFGDKKQEPEAVRRAARGYVQGYGAAWLTERSRERRRVIRDSDTDPGAILLVTLIAGGLMVLGFFAGYHVRLIRKWPVVSGSVLIAVCTYITYRLGRKRKTRSARSRRQKR